MSQGAAAGAGAFAKAIAFVKAGALAKAAAPAGVRAVLVLLAGWLLAAAAPAQERILSYDSELLVRADGSLDVTETLRVRAEGQQIRRGIYRDFPTRYEDGYGNRVVVDFELLGVERDGRPEPHFTERLPNGIRINTGNDDFLPTPGEFTYTLRYRTTRQLGFFAEHDELYWNVTGVGWAFPIEVAQARVKLPTEVPAELMQLEAYTGRAGEKGRSWHGGSPFPGTASFRTTRTLGSEEGLTIVVGFPKGIVREPTSSERWAWFLRDNRGVLVALAALAMLLAFYLLRWHGHGRDPAAGPVFPRYAPPAGFSPGELRMLRRMGYDNLCFSADVVDLAVQGMLDIHQGASADGWRLSLRPSGKRESLGQAQRALLEKLFAGSPQVVLKNTEAARVGGAIATHQGKMSKRLAPRYFVSNGGSLLAGVLFSLAAWAIAFALSGGSGLPAIVVLAVLALAAHIAFGWLLRAPTREGRKLMDAIEGLRLYLGVAERDELKAVAGPVGAEPALDAGRYEALLPYAMALEVEAAWTGKFTRAVGAAVALQSRPDWYHGSGGMPAQGLASMGSSLGTALTREISSSSTPPGSSSGGGGGGSSGGGGGGGGGGGR